MEGIRAVLIQKRNEQGLSQTALAKKAKVSLSTLQKFEDGGTPGIDKIIKIAAALGCTIDSTTLLPETLKKYQPHKLPKDAKIGDVYGKRKILGPAKMDTFKHTSVLCECSCEKHTLAYVDWTRLKRGYSGDCGCERKNKIAEAARKKGVTAPPAPDEDLRGQIFQSYLVLDVPPRRNGGKWEWYCESQETGERRWIRGTKLKSGEALGRPKGRKSRVPEDMKGMQFGFLKVQKRRKLDKNGNILVHAKCLGCGRSAFYRATHLLDHATLSCGCAPKMKANVEIGPYVLTGNKRIGDSGFPEQECWINSVTDHTEWVMREQLLRMVLEERKNDD